MRFDTRLMCWGVGCFLLGIASSRADETGEVPEHHPSKAKDKVLVSVSEAYRAAVTKLRSGIGNGIYTASVSDPSRKAVTTTVISKVKFFFDGKKFHIRLDYQKDLVEHLDSLISISDGTAFANNRLSKRLKPRGSLANIYDVVEGRWSSSTRLPFDLRKLPAEILDFEELHQHDLLQSIDIIPRSDGSVTGRSRKDQFEWEFDIQPKFGYNISSFRVSRITDKRVFQVCNAKWEHKDGVWFVKTITTEFIPLNDAPITRSEFRYENFEPNAKVPPEMFRLSALEMPLGTLIGDNRKSASGDFRNLPANQTDQSKLDTMIAEVEAIRAAQRLRFFEKEKGFRWLRAGLIGGGVVLSLSGLVLFWNRRRRQPPAGT